MTRYEQIPSELDNEARVPGIPTLIENLQKRAEENAVAAAQRARDLDWLLGEIRNRYPLWAEELQAELDRRKQR